MSVYKGASMLDFFKTMALVCSGMGKFKIFGRVQFLSHRSFFSLLEVTIVCWLLSREIPLQGSYLEQPCGGQFHYGDDCKGLLIPEAIWTFLVCPVVGKELAGWGIDSAKELEDRLPCEIYQPVLATWSAGCLSNDMVRLRASLSVLDRVERLSVGSTDVEEVQRDQIQALKLRRMCEI